MPGALQQVQPGARHLLVEKPGLGRGDNAILLSLDDDHPARPWLQAYWYSLDEMLSQKQAADDAGSTGWTFWNAGGVYDQSLFANVP